MDDLDQFLKEHPNVKVKESFGATVPGAVPVYIPREYPPNYTPFEEEEQADYVAWLTIVRPDIRFFSVPNGGRRSKREGAMLQRTGVKAGVPDLVFPFACGPYHHLYQETKRIKGGKVEASQAIWHDYLRIQGCCVDVCFGAEGLKKSLLAYLALGPFKT